MIKRYMITVAYDGTDYCGWQIQPNGITIEQVLNEALTELMKQPVRIIGASRTDSGVHALGNVAVFDAETTIPGDRICFALNALLPEDIRVVASRQVDLGFHPRYTDSRKTYEYRIQNGRIPYPTRNRYTHFTGCPLDLEAMREGAAFLLGKHDFKSFCAAATSVKTTVRNVLRIDIRKEILTDPGAPEIVIEITGEGFLYNMVRIIAGTLVKVGLHVYPPEHVGEILEARDREKAGETAPAKGLLLKSITFDL